MWQPRRNVSPRPVDANGTELYAVVVSNLTAGVTSGVVKVLCPALPATYSKSSIYADDAGCICLWLAPTNRARALVVNGRYYTTPYPYESTGSGTSPLYCEDVVATYLGDPPEGWNVDGETLYRLTVPSLPRNVAAAVEGNIAGERLSAR